MPSSRGSPDLGIRLVTPASPALQAGSLPTEPSGKPKICLKGSSDRLWGISALQTAFKWGEREHWERGGRKEQSL